MDVFHLFVEFTSGEGAFRETPRTASVSVLAATTNEAELMALEMVAATGRCPVDVKVNWTYF
jgi:hypothetical protein